MNFAPPIIQQRIDIQAEQISSMIAAHQEEIAEYIRQGVKRATSNAAEKIVEEAYQQATKAISKGIEDYFLWGEGKKAMIAALQPHLVKVMEQAFGEMAKR